MSDSSEKSGVSHLSSVHPTAPGNENTTFQVLTVKLNGLTYLPRAQSFKLYVEGKRENGLFD